MYKTFLVFDEGSGGGVAGQATPPAGGPVSNETPPAPAQDAGADVAALKAQVEKYEQDIRRMKSTFQSNEAQLNQKLAERERQFKDEMDRLRRSMLDEDDLKVYEAESAKSNLAELEQQYNEAQTALAQERALRSTISLFAQEGIPLDVLIQASDNGLEGVTQAAWGWLFEERKRLAAEATTKKEEPKQPPVKPPEPPATSTTTAPAFTGPKWPELVKQYGSREMVYTLVEAGRLPATIIPPEG